MCRCVWEGLLLTSSSYVASCFFHSERMRLVTGSAGCRLRVLS